VARPRGRERAPSPSVPNSRHVDGGIACVEQGRARCSRLRCARPRPAAQAKLSRWCKRLAVLPFILGSLRAALVSDAIAGRPRPLLLPLADSASGTADGKGQRTFRRLPACRRGHPLSPPPIKARRETTPHAGSTDMTSAIDTRHNNLKCWGPALSRMRVSLVQSGPSGSRRRT